MSDYNKILLNYLRETSDGISFYDCFRLCASKENLDALARPISQVVWGRRGTGKTTLLKAFSYRINNIVSKDSIAFYIMMSKISPTAEEIKSIHNHDIDLTIYIFKKLLMKVCVFIGEQYEQKEASLSWKARSQFIDYYYLLEDAVSIGTEVLVSASKTSNSESTSEKDKGFSLSSELTSDKSTIFRPKLFFSSFRKKALTKKINKEIRFYVNTEFVHNTITKMLDLLSIKHIYLCLDEFSDIDKIESTAKYSIQSQLAQLVKQTFLKSPYFSVKIAAVWNDSKIHDRSINRNQGLEYKEDIFEGPDLDIMFLDDNDEALKFFKEIIVNTYLLSKTETISDNEKQALMDAIIDKIFGEDHFRHIVCGSQGIARCFAVLALEYINRSSREKGKLGFDQVFQLIIDQYLDNVRNRIPYALDIPQAVNEYVNNNDIRYFLINKKDYDRCEHVIKYLASKNYFMQFPGHKTDRIIRDHYKLFLLNYGNFLDARKMDLKILSYDSKLTKNGLLFPKISKCLIENPEKYCIALPPDSQNQYYCSKCSSIIHISGNACYCPSCGNAIQPYNGLSFSEDVVGC